MSEHTDFDGGNLEGSWNKYGSLAFLIFICTLLLLIIVPINCTDNPKYNQNLNATVSLTFPTANAGNGVFIEYKDDLYILSAAHLCDVELIIKTLAIRYENDEQSLVKDILYLSKLVAKKDVCSADVKLSQVGLIPKSVEIPTIKAKAVAVDFYMDFLLLKLEKDYSWLEVAGIKPVNILEEDVFIGEPIYSIGSLTDMGRQPIMGFSKIGFYAVMKTDEAKEARTYLQTHLNSCPGLSGSGVFREKDGALIGLVGAVAAFANNDTMVLPYKNINTFLKMIPEEASIEKPDCLGTKDQCAVFGLPTK